jgi:putative mycofactocin binding protein MftB
LSTHCDFDLDGSWTVAPQVALRPEPFGALAYHFGTRRLSFLKTTKLLAVVQRLGEQPSGREACTSAGVGQAELPSYCQALAVLADKGMIVRRATT